MSATATKDSLLRQSLWYAAAASAAAVVPAQTADAQIVYTDVDPDVTVTNGQFDIDFDGDGDSEIAILESTQNRDQILIATDPASADFVDGAIGNGFPYGTNSYGYVLPVSAGAEISAANSDFILLANYTLPGQATFTFGGADPNDWIGEGEQFVGIRFQLGEGTQHYAWIRVDVPSAGQVRVIDYAFQSTPDTPIMAGEMGVAVEPGALPDGYEFTPVGPNPIRSTAHFSLMVAENEAVRVSVFDMLGREVASVFEGELAGGVARRMELNVSDLPAGTYVVRATGDSFDTVQRVTVTH